MVDVYCGTTITNEDHKRLEMEAKTLLLNLSKHGLVEVLNQRTTVRVSKGGAAIVKCRLLTPHTSIQIFFFLACLVKICQREEKTRGELYTLF